MPEQIGRYEILEEIGRGGFAIVYKARDTKLDRLVALKELRPLLLEDADWVRRFRREARTIARLDHPHIVPIHDVHEADNRLFLVMRLVNGPGLDDLIAEAGQISWTEAVAIISDLAAGLDYAHNQGILHRDLKPANILIDTERGPMLTDFGLAKLAGESSLSITAAGSVVGTPHYIAPEVWEGQGSSVRSDIYALGCILHEILTGDKVFKGASAPVVMMAHFKPLELPQTWPTGVPDGVSTVLAKALANDPAKRYAAAGDLAAELRRLSAPDTASPTPPIAREMAKAKERLQSGPQIMPSGDGRHQQPAAPAPAYAGAFGPAFDDEDVSSEPFEDTDGSNTWRGFLTHLGPYVFVIGALAVINLLTSDYPWFLWPAIGWGIGLAFHFKKVAFPALDNIQSKWQEFANHLASYVIVIGALMLMNLLSSRYPWFLWPALFWGIGLASHFWKTLVSNDEAKTSRRQRRRAARRKRAPAEQAIRPAAAEAGPSPRAESLADTPVDAAVRTHLQKARAYKSQIDALVNSTTNIQIQPHLQALAGQVNRWTQAIEALARRVDKFQQNSLIQHDLETVPQAIDKLETQLATETDPATRAELERAIGNRKNQLEALQNLQATMRRAEIKIENTLSLLGTLYPQIMTSQSTNQVADYSRLSAEVDEEVRVLQDHLEALEEVKLNRAGSP